MTTKQEILDYLDNVLHPIVSPDNWNVYSELHDMIEDFPSAEPQWIPVSERLPDHDECIKNNRLFNVSDGNRSYSEWFDYDKQKFGEPTMAGFRVDYAVTAWMPLPNPYEGEC